MKAVGFTEFGGPEVLREFELPEPVVGPGQVRVRVAATAVSPTDIMRRTGALAADTPLTGDPFVPGMDFAGYLEELGPGAQEALIEPGLRVGSRVMGLMFPVGTNGGYAEQVVVPAESIVELPEGLSFAAASTLPMNGMTAQLLLDTLDLQPGDSLAITGAAGTVGSYVAQLALARGLRVIVDSSERDRPFLQALGATAVVKRGDDVAERFRQIVPRGVDALVDCALLNDKVLPAIRDGGQMATVRFYVGPDVRGIVYHPVKVRTYVREGHKLAELRDLAIAGDLTLRVAGTYAAAQAAAAHKALEEGGLRGRLVLILDDAR